MMDNSWETQVKLAAHSITSNGLAVDEGRVDTSQDSTGEDNRMYLVCCIPQYATPCSASGDPQVIGSSARCDN